MLFSDIPHRHLFAFAVGDCPTEDALAQENSFCMMPKSAMPEIREVRFGLVKPVMDPDVVLGFAANFSRAAFRVLQWMGHG
jgi:hypothetical protein